MKQTSKIHFLAAAAGFASSAVTYATVKGVVAAATGFIVLPTVLSLGAAFATSFYAYDYLSGGQLSGLPVRGKNPAPKTPELL